MRGNGIAGGAEEGGIGLGEEGVHGGIEVVKVFAEAGGVELFAALGEDLAHRDADAAAFVAQEREQAYGGAAQLAREIEEGGDVDGGEDEAEAGDHDNARPDD